MAYLPLFMDIADRNILVVGGGRKGLDRARTLLTLGARVRLVTMTADPLVMDLDLENEDLRVELRSFVASDVRNDLFAVVSATGDPELNGWIASLCSEKKILLSCEGDPEHSSFLFSPDK